MEIIKNKEFLNWYVNPKEITKDDVEKLYHMFMSAYNEDEKLFMKITLYIAGTRTKFTDTHFKCVLHFLSTNYTEKIMCNLHLFVKFGNICILNYLLQEQTIKNRINTFIKYHASYILMYKDFINDKNSVFNYKKYFKFKLKNNNLERLLDKIETNEELNLIL